MLEKIMYKGDEFTPDYVNMVGKNITIPANLDSRSIDTNYIELREFKNFVITYASDDFNLKGTIKKIVSINGEPFALYYHAGVPGKLGSGYSTISLPYLLKNGGVFNSLLTHIKQAFRVSLLKRGALNA